MAKQTKGASIDVPTIDESNVNPTNEGTSNEPVNDVPTGDQGDQGDNPTPTPEEPTSEKLTQLRARYDDLEEKIGMHYINKTSQSKEAKTLKLEQFKVNGEIEQELRDIEKAKQERLRQEKLNEKFQEVEKMENLDRELMTYLFERTRLNMPDRTIEGENEINARYQEQKEKVKNMAAGIGTRSTTTGTGTGTGTPRTGTKKSEIVEKFKNHRANGLSIKDARYQIKHVDTYSVDGKPFDDGTADLAISAYLESIGEK